jgi:hypothetical protein
MGRLEVATTSLDVLGSVVLAVPVVGDTLKSAIEVVTKICEMVQVCLFYFSSLNAFSETTQRR